MKTKNQISIKRKALFGVMLLGLFFSIFGAGNLPSARAQEGEPVTPTPEVQVSEPVTPTPEVQVPDPATPMPEVQMPEPVTPAPGREPRIVGGALADPGEYPWQVEVDNYHSTSHTGSFGLCGGSLIDSQWVLTAGHCVTEIDGSGNVSASGFLEVYTGEYDRTGVNGYEYRSVIKVIRHPSYNDNTLDNDIALVRLSSPVTIPNGANNLPWTNTNTIPLVSATIGSLAGVNAWVTGWGLTSEGGSPSDQLREVQLPVIANSDCYNGEITSNMMCAGYAAGGKDACQGDSGGPLVVWNAGTSRWNLAGVTSSGDGCARPNSPGIYTRVSQYVSWINSYTIPVVLVVQNTNDSGSGSLRQAIASAGNGDTIITFAPGLSGATIRLASMLTINKNVTIDGSALTSKITISGDTDGNGTGDVMVFYFNQDITATLNSLIITKGHSNGNGGGIYNGATLTVTNSTLSGNSAGRVGGGIYNWGTLTITNSTISDNSTQFGESGYGNGGGIYNDGTLTIANSTFSGNSTSSSGYGGGIYNQNSHTLTVTNSTLSGNSAQFGGGIFNNSTLTVSNSTFSGNSANNSGGGIYNNSGSTLHYMNTIIANSSSGGDCSNAGTIGTNTNNLVENGITCSAILGDPGLGTLANNGGPTQTMALNIGSIAINAGADCSAEPVNGLDQRGYLRDASCDIGSYEYGGTTPPDLVITNVTLSDPNSVPPGNKPFNPGPGVPFNVEVTVKNQGGSDIGVDTSTRLYINPSTVPSSCPSVTGIVATTSWTTPDLSSGGEVTYTYPVSGGLPAGIHKIYAYADATCVVNNEGSEDNNAYGPITVGHTQVSDKYLIPMYFGASSPSTLVPSLHIANVDTMDTTVDVKIGGVNQYPAGYPLKSGESMVVNYVIDGGPVEIQSRNEALIVASLNQQRRRAGITAWTGVSQSMALPVANISSQYVLPRYDYTSTSTKLNQILIANLDGVSRKINVKIGNNIINQTYTLDASMSQYLRYSGTIGGPVVVTAVDDAGNKIADAKIVASLYELVRDPAYAGWNGQSEMMGLPWSQVSDKYLIPMYFGASSPSTLVPSLYIANVDTMDTTVDVKIGGVNQYPAGYPLKSGESMVVNYVIDGGPVEIQSRNEALIVASLNQQRRRAGITAWTGVSQSMALPVANISNQYVLPRYDYTSTSTKLNQVLIANLDGVSRKINVKIGNNIINQTYTLDASMSQYLRYSGTIGGPVVVTAVDDAGNTITGAQIVASLYELVRDPAYAGWNDQSEMLGLP